MTTFACSHCNRLLEVEDNLANQQVRCPGCQQLLVVPPNSSAPNATASPEDLTSKSTAQAQILESDPTQTWSGRSLLEGKTPSPPAGDQPAVDFSFLIPPQQPDELGRLGAYRVLKVLGAGGMGVVFQAEDPVLKRIVAIKAMLPAVAATVANRQRFLREAQATAQLGHHEHIVTIYLVGEQQGIPYLVMQFLQGCPLDVRLRNEPILPVADVLRIGREIAEGLAAAHEHGLIHRDIKPANIWLEGSRGRVKILDFGLARAITEDAQITQSGTILGTPAFMSPEQAKAKGVDHRTDLFSLGSLLYRLCTGQLPFLAKDVMATLLALVSESPIPMVDLNPRLPRALDDLVMRLMSKHPDDRPASAVLVAEELAAIASGLASNHTLLSPPPPLLTPLEPAAPLFLDLDEPLISAEETEPEPASGAPPGLPGDPAPLLPADRLEELAGYRLGRFALGRVIGRGHHGVVFRARDLKADQLVALKILFPDFPHNDGETQRFALTMKTMLGLQHPNLVPLFAGGKTGPYGWLAMEYVPGENLAHFIRDRGCNWKLALRVATHVGRALDLASQHRLIHRNITPWNILVRSTDQVVLLNDLLLEKALRRTRLQQNVLDAKLEREAPYLAPEQIDCAASYVDLLCDLYSLGVVLYVLLTGQLPFSGSSMEETLDQIRVGGPTKPRKYHKSIPVEFERVVLRMMARDQVDRYQKPADLLLELRVIAADHGEKL